jgi:predicted nucleotidyltransferase
METFEETKDSLSPVITDIKQRLVHAYEPERIYLFGSAARGDVHPDSDYDFMLIVGDNAPPERRRSRLAYQVLRGTGIAVDVLVWTKREFEARLHLKASFPSTVVREGKLIYAS